MKNVIFTVLIVLLVGVAAFTPYTLQQRKIDKLNKQVSELTTKKETAEPPTTQNQQTITPYTSTKGVAIQVYTPASNAKVTSPVAIIGKVPGNWSFEASFPVQLKDSNGNSIATGTAQLLGDWMTDQLVPFSVQLTYASTTSGNGTLVLQKDNPSGLAENDDSVSIPVKF